MAHPCFSCGSECWCSGDIDDVIVSRTPARCEGCGCPTGDDDTEEDDWYSTCPHCGRDECFNDRCLDEHHHPIYQNGPTR